MRPLVVEEDTTIFVKPASDNGLTRSLTIQEFVLAFSIFRSVMCEVYPNRREELDAYLRDIHDIVEMSSRFGSGFYGYHRAFSAKAASFLLNHQVTLIGLSVTQIIHYDILRSASC